MKKHFLVTGGAGFIGSHLAAALMAAGHRVRVLDDLSTGKRANLAPGAELIVGDVADRALVGNAVAGVDGCFHLAAVASVERSVEDWLGTHRTNLGGTITVLQAIRARGGPRIPLVYASSAAVYGEPAALPITELADCRPSSAYGADKLGSELHARVATGMHGIPTTGLRLFNVYGPGQDPASPYSGVISRFAARLPAGRPVDVFGDGRQTRDFIYVGDVVAAFIGAMERRLPGAPVFNVCTGIATSVLDLAQAIAALCGVAAETRLHPPRAGEIRHSLGSPAAGKAALGLPEPTPLKAGLGKVLAWLATPEALSTRASENQACQPDNNQPKQQ